MHFPGSATGRVKMGGEERIEMYPFNVKETPGDVLTQIFKGLCIKLEM